MMSYATEHAGARADIAAAGMPVVFAKASSAQDAATGQLMTTGVTVPGSAIRVAGDPKKYAELGLVVRDAITLLFAPDAYGSTPALGSKVTWNGQDYTVHHVEPVAPDGATIIARVVVVL